MADNYVIREAHVTDAAAMAHVQVDTWRTAYPGIIPQSYLDALAPKGVLHTVGVVPDPIPVPAFALIVGQKSVSGSPLGSPALTRKMMAFCARHKILPVTEQFELKNVNEALARLESGKARYRIILKI